MIVDHPIIVKNAFRDDLDDRRPSNNYPINDLSLTLARSIQTSEAFSCEEPTNL